MRKKRAESAAWQHLYWTPKWKRLREWHKAHNPLCVYCLEREEVSAVEVVDHIRPHKGDQELFWDPNNLQSLCRSCHDGRKQSEERGTKYVAFGPDGWPL